MSLVLALLQGAAGAAVQVTVDADGDAAPFPHFWKRAFGSGHAALGLRDDWQDAVARAARDYGLGGLRFHGIFDDDMGVVAGLRADGTAVYDFSNVDVLWDAHVRNGVAPLVELGFMPTILANCSSPEFSHPSLPNCTMGGWIRTGTAAPPRRWSDWSDLVSATAAHAVERYGVDEVRGWDWEVWNELWGVTGASEAVLGEYTATFYAHSAKALKRVGPELRVGGPAGASTVFLRQFLAEAAALDLPVDFISFHAYGNPRECPAVASDARDPPPKTSTGFFWRPDCYGEMMAWAVDEVKSVNETLPIYVTEYSVSVGEHKDGHDTSRGAAFAFRAVGGQCTRTRASYHKTWG